MKGDKYLYNNGTVRGPVTMEIPVLKRMDMQRKYRGDVDRYKEHLTSLPSIKVEGNHWKEGQELIEGKHFYLRKVSLARGAFYKLEGDDKIRQPLADELGYYYLVAAPYQSAQEPEGEKPKKLRLEYFPHLVEMERQIKMLRPHSVEYWKQRCRNLEKSIDPTYTDFERSNCRHLYRILVNNES